MARQPAHSFESAVAANGSRDGLVRPAGSTNSQIIGERSGWPLTFGIPTHMPPKKGRPITGIRETRLCK